MIYVLHTDSGREVAFYTRSCAEMYQQLLGGWIECVEQAGLSA